MWSLNMQDDNSFWLGLAEERVIWQATEIDYVAWVLVYVSVLLIILLGSYSSYGRYVGLASSFGTCQCVERIVHTRQSYPIL